jgi:hypothetical protein
VGEIRLGASGLATASPLKFSATVGRELRQRVAISTTPCLSQNATRFWLSGCTWLFGETAIAPWVCSHPNTTNTFWYVSPASSVTLPACIRMNLPYLFFWYLLF